VSGRIVPSGTDDIEAGTACLVDEEARSVGNDCTEAHVAFDNLRHGRWTKKYLFGSVGMANSSEGLSPTWITRPPGRKPFIESATWL
jgi:hypothetical protein